MQRARRSQWQHRSRRRRVASTCVGAGFLLLAFGAGSRAGAEAVTARQGLPVALHAADVWADDARLVWVENDTPVDAGGRAQAWGYLFYSPGLHAMRSYSVRDGQLVRAEDQPVSVAAPELETWLDSGEVLQRACHQAAAEGEPEKLPESLLLVRGIFAPRTAWVAVFARAGGTRLFVVCDAGSGEVLRAWRG